MPLADGFEALDEARQAFEKVAQLAPDNLLPLDQLVDLDLQDKHFDNALQRVRTQFQKNPDVAAAHYFEGKILAADTPENLQRLMSSNSQVIAEIDDSTVAATLGEADLARTVTIRGEPLS